MIKFSLNDQPRRVDAASDMPLLWVLRDVLNMTGTKYGCSNAQCGACTVHVDGEPMRACILPASAVAGKHVTTIEGLSQNGHVHPVQKAWMDLQVPQCGYCQSGQIMRVISLLEKSPNPTDQDIDQVLVNMCHCGTYAQIRKAIHAIARQNGGLRTKPAIARPRAAESATAKHATAKRATARRATAKHAAAKHAATRRVSARRTRPASARSARA
ncbi:MAG: (2Fe-2S)-binding protein [Betaproteobacteria bacterium]|nr:(2Fe-2S)-binding protein [Betaproteobacteria bacterium]